MPFPTMRKARRGALLAALGAILACGTSAPSAPTPSAPRTRYTPQEASALAQKVCKGKPRDVLRCYLRIWDEPAPK